VAREKSGNGCDFGRDTDRADPRELPATLRRQSRYIERVARRAILRSCAERQPAAGAEVTTSCLDGAFAPCARTCTRGAVVLAGLHVVPTDFDSMR